MTDLEVDALARQIQRTDRRVRSLQAAVYSQADPSANADLHRQLIEEEMRVQELEQQSVNLPTPTGDDRTPTAPHSHLLGPETTGLRVVPTLNMQPLPTGIYHLLDPETDPLLTVVVENKSRDTRRVCVKAFVEGLSAQAVRTTEIGRRDQTTLKLLPTLLPEQARAITEVQRATLHVLAEDLDGKTESHETFSLVCLARTSSFNAVRRPGTNQRVDLSHYYGAWVTPHAEAVQERIRRAADLLADRMIWGYQGTADSVTRQVAALYDSLREAGIAYINSVIDYGAAQGQVTQRTRLPREALAGKSANCIDGTVLMASLLEGASLNAALVLVPGHAFVGWETWEESGQWQFLETTLIGRADFDVAHQSGQRQYDEYQKSAPDRVTLHRLSDLRARGIWPME